MLLKKPEGTGALSCYVLFCISDEKSVKGQTILILLPEVSHSSCCQWYSVVYLAKARLQQFMAIASKNELRGEMDALVHFHLLSPFPWNASCLKAKPHAQARLLLTKKRYGNSKCGRELSFTFLCAKFHWEVGDCFEPFAPLVKPLHTLLAQLTSLPSRTSYNTQKDLEKGTGHMTKKFSVESLLSEKPWEVIAFASGS